MKQQDPLAEPAPSALDAVLALTGQSKLFRDLTGLEQTQKNALTALNTGFDGVKESAAEAADLVKSQVQSGAGVTEKSLSAIDTAKKKGMIDGSQASDLVSKLLGSKAGTPDPKAKDKPSPKDKPITQDSSIQKAIDSAKMSDAYKVKVSRGDESVAVSTNSDDDEMDPGKMSTV